MIAIKRLMIAQKSDVEILRLCSLIGTATVQGMSYAVLTALSITIKSSLSFSEIFHIPLSRPIMSTPVSISSINGLTIRQNGKYIYNSTASKPIKPASYTAAVIGGRNGLNVRAKMGIDSNGFTDTDIKNIVNNDTCAIMASIKITF